MSIQGNREAAKKMIEQGGLVRAGEPAAPNTPSIPTSSYPAAPNPLLRTPLPPLSVQQPDMQRQWQSTAVPQSRVTPLPPAANANSGSQAASQTNIVLTQSGGGGGLKVETNAQLVNTPLGLINFQDTAGVSWSADAQGNIKATASATGDNLTHPSGVVWEYDPTYVIERDDFLSINSSTTGDGGILSASFSSGAMWSFISSTFASDQPYWTPGGPIPNVGLLALPNNGTSGQANFLLRGPFTPHGMPLLDFPGWKLSWVFQISRVRDFPNGGSPTPAFSWAKVSMYVGLGNWGVNNTAATFANTTTPRPPFFLGLRYDTDTTAPSIGDTQFVFEYVNQTLATSYSRSNTQGTTASTGITVTEGNWYRFEMSCAAAGQVQMTLTDGTTSFTSTLSVAKITTTTNPGSVSVSNGTVFVSYGSTLLPVGVGSSLAVSYSGGGSSVSGTFSQFDVAPNATTLRFMGTGTGGVPTTSSASFYPAYAPIFVFGNDSQAAPTGWSKGVNIDYYAFVWNMNLGPNAPGTPNSLKSRYT